LEAHLYLSLFDPQSPKQQMDALDRKFRKPREPLVQLSAAVKKQLEAELLRIWARAEESGNSQEGFDQAYSAFAETFHRSGAPLTDMLLEVDMPNMVFNFAVRNGWFPHLRSLVPQNEARNITLRARIPDHLLRETSGRQRGVTPPPIRQSILWFKKQIRPAVLRWTAKAIELAEITNEGDSTRTTLPNPIKVSRRRNWLEPELKERGWTAGTLQKWTGPDRKTTLSYLNGNDITPASRKAIVDALNKQRPKNGRLLDVSELPE
jgi:hypothetical protein